MLWKGDVGTVKPYIESVASKYLQRLIFDMNVSRPLACAKRDLETRLFAVNVYLEALKTLAQRIDDAPLNPNHPWREVVGHCYLVGREAHRAMFVCSEIQVYESVNPQWWMLSCDDLAASLEKPVACGSDVTVDIDVEVRSRVINQDLENSARDDLYKMLGVGMNDRPGHYIHGRLKDKADRIQKALLANQFLEVFRMSGFLAVMSLSGIARVHALAYRPPDLLVDPFVTSSPGPIVEARADTVG